ncbi:DUF5518 domain-containing protein [Halorussus pelagicus]|uniref:DUF5518 domain-containing protein n=1 Tax=Halorussus pelagicus TaxID=2505977 RepID=UPI000FFC47F4|nr:DUF5518 domain-containing protein [Halorussus pelagicus]
MLSLRTLVADLTDESLRTATLVGLASIPFTVALSWDSITLPHEILSNGGINFDATISATAIFFAGAVVGYLYAGRPVEVERASTRAGVVGSAPMMVLVLLALPVVVWHGSSVLRVAIVVLTPLLVVMGAGFCAVVSLLGSILGKWVAEQIGRGRPASVEN